MYNIAVYLHLHLLYTCITLEKVTQYVKQTSDSIPLKLNLAPCFLNTNSFCFFSPEVHSMKSLNIYADEIRGAIWNFLQVVDVKTYFFLCK